MIIRVALCKYAQAGLALFCVEILQQLAKKGENDKYFKINLHERMLPYKHVTPDHQSDAHPAEPPGPAHTPQTLYDTIVGVHSINCVS